MKKCHSCGKIIENAERFMREVDEKYYCIICLNEAGKPLKPNEVRSSIRNFWHNREQQNANFRE